MRVEWFGQAAFGLTAADGTRVVIDPFGDVSSLSERGLRFDYPPLTAVSADLVLVTHEHGDHNGVEAIGGDPVVLRSTAGRLESPIGEVVAIASEHDDAAGTERGPNTIFVFTVDDIRVAHFGDFGQATLRPQQAAALGSVDLLFLPVGGMLTMGGEQAAAIATALAPRWVVPMHYRTARTNFLEPADDFLGRMEQVHRVEGPAFDLPGAYGADGSIVVVPAAP